MVSDDEVDEGQTTTTAAGASYDDNDDSRLEQYVIDELSVTF